MQSRKPNFIKGVWFWNCGVCSKQYSNDGAHKYCYKRFCSICNIIFKNNKDNKEHALRIHPKSFCDKCNQSYTMIIPHRKNRLCI